MSDTKVVLVVPPLIHAGVAFTSVAGPEHIGVAYLTASLRREGIATDVLNYDLDTYIRVMKHDGFAEREATPDEMADHILKREPTFVGVTVTGPTLQTSLRLAGALKERRPDLHVCFGGHQATAAAEALMVEEPTVDSIGLGDCDFTLPAFIKRLHAGDDLGEFYGFFYRAADGRVAGGWKPQAKKGDLIRLTTSAPRAQAQPTLAERYALWDLPHPSRDDLTVIRRETGANEARLSTSRGCMDFCTFCATSDSAGFRKHTLRPPEDVVAEIEELHQKHGIDHFWLVDDNFVSRSEASQERAADICRALIKSPIRVTMRAYFRADAFTGRPDLMPLLFRGGVTMGLIGVESATPRRLQYFGKHCTTDQMRSTIAAIRGVGMGLQIGYIFFDPMTSFPDMREDADFLLEVGEAYNLFNFVQSMDVYPGTPYRRMIQNKGLGHFTHTYRGGFRDYEYADARIAPLAAAMASLYSPPLMAIDRALMRLRAFNLPRLRWLDEQSLVPRADRRTYRDAATEAEVRFGEIGRINYEWVRSAIDLAEGSFSEAQLDTLLQAANARRRPHLQQLESLAGVIDRMAARLHAAANNRPASGAMEREGVSWAIC
ncbi:MAG TPA: radical SAM protein [Vicinamibacterales bacterium]|nr:radical SAM protein [Vicinamibacterales bacterium]